MHTTTTAPGRQASRLLVAALLLPVLAACTSSTGATTVRTVVRTVTVTVTPSTSSAAPSVPARPVQYSGNDPHGPLCRAITANEAEAASASHLVMVAGIVNVPNRSGTCTWFMTPTSECNCIAIGVSVGLNLSARALALFRTKYRDDVRAGRAKPVRGVPDGEVARGTTGEWGEADWIQADAQITLTVRLHYTWRPDDSAAALAIAPSVAARVPAIVAALRKELAR